MTNKNVGQGYKFALLHNVSNAMGQYLECGNLIIFFAIYIGWMYDVDVRQKKKQLKGKPLNWAYLTFFFKLTLS